MHVSPDTLCAYCRKRPVERRWRPFCSERCKLLDLSHWVDGAYRVPGGTVPRDPETTTDPDEDTHN